jgi:hypothetical protein
MKDIASQRAVKVLALAAGLVLLSGISAAPMQANTPVTGKGAIVTAPGVVASLTTAGAQITAVAPTKRKLSSRQLSDRKTRATYTFPVRNINDRKQIVLDGAIQLQSSTNDRVITLQDIRIDVAERQVYVRVREFFNQSIQAFDLTGDIDITERRVKTKSGTKVQTTITGARMTVSAQVGNLINSALGLGEADGVFRSGAVIGTANVTYRK